MRRARAVESVFSARRARATEKRKRTFALDRSRADWEIVPSERDSRDEARGSLWPKRVRAKGVDGGRCVERRVPLRIHEPVLEALAADSDTASPRAFLPEAASPIGVTPRPIPHDSRLESPLATLSASRSPRRIVVGDPRATRPRRRRSSRRRCARESDLPLAGGSEMRTSHFSRNTQTVLGDARSVTAHTCTLKYASSLSELKLVYFEVLDPTGPPPRHVNCSEAFHVSVKRARGQKAMSLARAALNLSASRAHALGVGRLRTDRRVTNARRRVSTTASAEMKTVRARESRDDVMSGRSLTLFAGTSASSPVSAPRGSTR